ncbi:hypothetical protein Tco_0534022 [Tanacetum coccineum]
MKGSDLAGKTGIPLPTHEVGAEVDGDAPKDTGTQRATTPLVPIQNHPVASDERGGSPSDSSDSNDSDSGHWKVRGRGRYRNCTNEDLALPWCRDKVDAFAGCIRRYSEDKKRRMPTNVKTYDGIGDPDDHLKVFEAAAKIERAGDGDLKKVYKVRIKMGLDSNHFANNFD